MKRVVVTISLIALIAPAAALARAPQSPLEPASRSACGPADSGHAPERTQEAALRCLINRVRDRAGVQKLTSHKALERAAGGKVGDVADCGLSHTVDEDTDEADLVVAVEAFGALVNRLIGD